MLPTPLPAQRESAPPGSASPGFPGLSRLLQALKGATCIHIWSSSENASGSRKNTGKKTEEIPYGRLLKMRVAPERIPARKQKKYPTVSI
ncbi:hypothetical protein NDU88_001449 [Pleurodeles waltl]|uniref:Uncharacterized protein n=1 Tax=Pleurodeles waltl TaxID=8319 RepID=A0AAV7V9V3_PLEWA|nr:hypothetical protein NDU88_001449 [Pleurodeles waltl]